MDIDTLLAQAQLANAKKALNSSMVQVEVLFTRLEEFMDPELVELLRQAHISQIERDLLGG